MFPSVVGHLEDVAVEAGPKDPISTGLLEKNYCVDSGRSLGKDRWEEQSERLRSGFQT